MGSIDVSNSIEISPECTGRLQRLLPRLHSGPHAVTADTFRKLGIAFSCEASCDQRGGLFLLNDCKEISTEVWSRLSLSSNKPLDCFSLEELIQLLMQNLEVREALYGADVIIAPTTAGPRVLAALWNAGHNNRRSGQLILEPAPVRTWNECNEPTVHLSSSDADLLQHTIQSGTHVVIVDDVASSFQTAAHIATLVKQQGAAEVRLVTLVGVRPKEQYHQALTESGLNAFHTAVITGYSGGESWKTPAIASTAGIFENSQKGKRRRTSIAKHLPDGGIALDVLQRRLEEDLRLLLVDLDGTLLNGTEPHEAICSAIQQARAKIFCVAATGRSFESFQGIHPHVRSLFNAAIVEGGMRLLVNGNPTRVHAPKASNKELQKLIERAARNTGAHVRVTKTAAQYDYPWWVRVRSDKAMLDTEEWNEHDTLAAMEFANNISNGRVQATASGYGDVLIIPHNIDKGTTGIAELARRIPTLPSLKSAISAGDGPNDIILLRRVREAGGKSVAVNPTMEEVSINASVTLCHDSFAKLLRDML